MTYQTVNPATGKLVQSYAEHTDVAVQKALKAAHTLYGSPWSKGPVGPRLKVLEKLADLLEARADGLAKVAVSEMGKLIGEARGEVQLVAEIARYYATNGEKFMAATPVETDRGRAWVEHHPIGVLVAIEPWNMPYYQLMRVLAPNFVVGNPVLAKPAPITPACALELAALVKEAGAPDGAWTNIFASNDQIATLLADERVRGVALTGSERAGAAVAAEAGRHLKKSVLELGGNDAFVVLDDADLELAVALGKGSRLAVTGQLCIAAKRFILHKAIADTFLEKLTSAFQAVKIGDPMDETTGLGPLSSRSALEGLTKQLEAAVRNGAKIHYGGEKVGGDGWYFPPTILTQVARQNPAYYEEFFGPVAQVYIVDNDEEAVRLANDSRYGLGGAIISRDTDRAARLASQIETGAIWINSAADSRPELPFGGTKNSGYGRELAEQGVREFANQKLIVVSGG
jgi:succinate-semialdehyde dehydrogenase/glutarate-semialdehyde dehydrogenase